MKKPLSIRTVISLVLALALTIFIMLSIILFNYFYTRSIMANGERSVREIITLVNNNIDYYISDIVDVADYVRNLARTAGQDKMNEQLQAIVGSRDDMVYIGLYNLDGTRRFASDYSNSVDPTTITSERWFERARDGEGDFFFSEPRIGRSDATLVITYSQLINYGSINEPSMPTILMIELNFNSIAELSQNANITESGYIYFISNDGYIIYHPYQKEMDEGSFKEDTESVNEHVYGTYISTFDGRNRLTTIETVNQTRWRIVGIAFIDEMMGELQVFRNYLLMLFLGMLLISVIMITSVSAHISKPLRELESAMRKVQEGDFSPTVPDGDYKEIRSLSESFRLMVSRIEELMKKVKTTEALKRERELEVLQAKINPHFLYNTLDSAVWMAESGDNRGVVKMMTSLASLFRISIAKGHDVITLKEELAHVESYLEIQSMRYKDKFSYSITLPKELENTPTIKLIVQPIVENSIYHGIKYLQETGIIEISVKEVDGKIEISVNDNGIGMDEETLSSLLVPGHETKGNGNGMGLCNIDERIKLSYGEDYGLKIESELDEGTRVTIVIPHLPSIEGTIIK